MTFEYICTYVVYLYLIHSTPLFLDQIYTFVQYPD